MFTSLQKTTQPARRQQTIGRFAITALLVLLMLSPLLAMASTTTTGGTGTGATNGVEIESAFNWLLSFIQGYGGKFIALAIFCVGMGATILTQKPHGAVVGFAGALLLAYMPGIIINFFTATLALGL